jgi:hypothetical protein
MATPHKRTSNGKGAKHQESFGFSEAQLEFLISKVKKAMMDSTDKQAKYTDKSVDLSGYATKYDLVQAENALRKDIHALENNMVVSNAALSKEISNSKHEMLKWLIGLSFAQISFMFALLKFFPH